ncbi:hypothetical protein WJ970_27040 [Achromobacter xylosoxidans]
MLVALVIVAIAASLVSLSVGRGDNRLRADAQRLADAFAVAQGEARSDGAPSAGWPTRRVGPSSGPTAPTSLPRPRMPPRPPTDWNAIRSCARRAGAPGPWTSGSIRPYAGLQHRVGRRSARPASARGRSQRDAAARRRRPL